MQEFATVYRKTLIIVRLPDHKNSLNLADFRINRNEKKKSKNLLQKGISFIFHVRERLLELITDAGLLGAVVRRRPTCHVLQLAHNT